MMLLTAMTGKFVVVAPPKTVLAVNPTVLVPGIKARFCTQTKPCTSTNPGVVVPLMVAVTVAVASLTCASKAKLVPRIGVAVWGQTSDKTGGLVLGEKFSVKLALVLLPAQSVAWSVMMFAPLAR